MGNTHPATWYRPVKSTDASAMFHALDVHGNGYLTLKDLMDSPAPGLMMLHSLPALFFFDQKKNGHLTEDEFTSLFHFCQSEKRKVEDNLIHDKTFRNLILRASKAGVKDCSISGRFSYRRLSSYANVRSVISSRRLAHEAMSSSHALHHCLGNKAFVGSRDMQDSTCLTSDDLDTTLAHNIQPSLPHRANPTLSANSSFQSTSELTHLSLNESEPQDDINSADPDLRNPQNRTAVDVAVLENIINSSIHKLADLLHTEGSREKFMSWLWELADFNSSGVVTLEELRVFLCALSEDGIDLGELAFYREGGEPLEVCIINEFDTTHAGLLNRDEFMVLADLVTREYEFWENRHLERIGDYELGRTIGRGSSGIVRLAIHVETRHKFAIKIIKKGKCSDLCRLDREIHSLMAMEHKHIVALEEVLDSDNNIFIVMELCGGGSMVDIVRLYPEERMPEETARFFVRQVFEALAFCHQSGICHRDVRLDNVMLDNAGYVKITDFGHSGMYSPGWDLFSTSLVGSVFNLSPEQVLGRVYSGEKIDIWSAGVAVYCLLVGRPPFCEPEVNLLLDSITSGKFEVPDFVSSKARELIECMIRADPEERIPMQQILRHPWFYEGPEYGPSMNVVVFPVDRFFKKRPDIAEMILAITIYQHNLHFHLGDAHNPHSSPDEQRGQDWTLRCLCPRNDIKLTVSLFTKKPHAAKKSQKLTSVASEACIARPEIERTNLDTSDMLGEEVGGQGPGRPWTSRSRAAKLPCGRPPVQRKLYKVTPMDVAAHIRASCHGIDGSTTDPFDFDLDQDKPNIAMHSFSEGMLRRDNDTTEESGFKEPRKAHARSHSLDENVSVKRMNLSAAVEAFPYQKVFPQRKMPESARNLDFSRPESPGVGSMIADESGLTGGRNAVEAKQSKALESKAEKGAVSANGRHVEWDMESAEMEPFIEVRLQHGESGLFLKICRKLKTICLTKLAAAAERQKSKTCGRRSLTALRRTASARCSEGLGGQHGPRTKEER